MRRAVSLVIVSSVMLACAPANMVATRESDAPLPPLAIELSRLDWPKVAEVDALVALARSAAAKLKAKGQTIDFVPGEAALKPFELIATPQVIPEGLVLMLRTRPITGQIVMITVEPMAAGDMKLPRFIGKIEDTAHPHIKHAILREPPRIDPADFELPVIRWKNFKNLDRERTTTPWPRLMQPPGYPQEMLRAGIEGEVKVEFTVTRQGEVAGLTVTASHVEFEPAIREAAAGWRFEPGVDVTTRLPADARISLTVRFQLEE